MPQCHCTSKSCNGAEVDKRTLRHHQQADRHLLYEQAINASQHAVDSEESRIQEFVNSFTMSHGDEESHRSDRTWTTQVPFKPVTDIMKSLQAIERDFKRLVNNEELQIRSLGCPQSRNDPFPLTGLLQKVKSQRNRIARIHRSVAAVHELRIRLETDIAVFHQTLTTARDEWNRQRQSLPEVEEPTTQTYNTESFFRPILPGVDPALQLLMFVTVSLHVILKLPRRGCRFLLLGARYLVQLALGRHKSQLTEDETAFVESFPIDPGSVLDKWPLDGIETIYAVCPSLKCHKTYAPLFLQNNPIPVYPKYCNYREFTDSQQCSTRLTRTRRMGRGFIFEVPIKRFVAFSFLNFMANLLTRPGYEELMDNPHERTRGGEDQNEDQNEDELSEDELRDIRHSEFMAHFKDHDDQTFRSSHGIGRYSFSMCLDFFNPYLNKQAGKKYSIGMISVVCLSLPPELRYKPENMFLAGVIPGPKEPTITTVGHYVTPLVDEFLVLWKPGVQFQRTAMYEFGRLVLAALILVICDLHATRKLAGFGAINHEHFCSLCHCTRRKEGYGDTNYNSWRHRTDAEYRAAARTFLTAPSEEARDKSFASTGIRFSELLRLPYFDFSRCVVVDSMHNLLLGVIRKHFVEILGIGLPANREDPVLSIILRECPTTFSDNDVYQVSRVQTLLEAPILASFPTPDMVDRRMKPATINALSFICGELNIVLPAPAKPGAKLPKSIIIDRLLEWRRSQQEYRDAGANSATRHGHVLDLDDMEGIWEDIENIVTPSWVASVPSNLGNSSHGKLKADQWRVLGSIHLPLSLIRRWGQVDPSNPRSVRCRRILDVTISLLSAISIATSHITSNHHAEEYLEHMLNYLNGIKELFPEYKLHINHHMALHLHEFLTLFGPVHSWWAFPMERMIGALQQMLHNFKPGEIEDSISRAYTRSANLRAIVKRSGCPEVVQHAQAIFQQLVDPQVRDSLSSDIKTLAPVGRAEPQSFSTPDNLPIPISSVPTELYALLRKTGSASCILRSAVDIHGLAFTTSSKHQGNACAMVSTSTGPVPARIEHIVQVPGQAEVLLAVRHHQPSQLIYDPFIIKALNSCSWSAEVGDLTLVPSSHVISHYAYLSVDLFGQQYVAVVPLWRQTSYLSRDKESASEED